MNTQEPLLVSVIMPVYNGEKFLHTAIDSILGQTYQNIELIIVNDGSSDTTPQIIGSYSDSRIVFVDQIGNQGVVAAMERGLAKAQGTYIVRADADDISLRNRIKEQVEFMEKHPEVGVVSTWMRTIGTRSGYLLKTFTNDADIKANLLFNTSIAQPTVCMRSSLFHKYGLRYDPAFAGGAEDYDLWTRASAVTQFACLPYVLVHYRIHAQNISTTRAEENRKNTETIRVRELAALGITPTPKELALHSRIKCPDTGREKILEFLDAQKEWMQKLEAANDVTHRYETASLQRMTSHRWFLICDANTRAGISILWRSFRTPPEVLLFQEGFLACVKFVIKAIIRR